MHRVLASTTTSNDSQVIDLGLVGYKQAWDLQKELHGQRVSGKIPDTLLLLEHKPVITLGKSGRESNILVARRLLEEKGIEFFHIERGGDITFHGPGQIVGYPIFLLRERLAGVRRFVEKLQTILIMTLKEFSIDAQVRQRYVGVWVDGEKIASIGIAVKRWVTFHGFALNVNVDLDFFKLIVPCGLEGIKVTSIEKILKRRAPIDEVKARIKDNFRRVFETGFCDKESVDFK